MNKHNGVTKKTVETMIRARGYKGPITWRDNQKSTYMQVYEYLIKHPDFKPVYSENDEV